MTENKPIIIDGLSCDNCPEVQRCQEQRAKKEYTINQVLQDVPSEYANVINRLKQIIPSITRCDHVLEKQLTRKTQECEELKKCLFQVQNTSISLSKQLDQLKAAKEQAEQKLKRIRDICKSYCELMCSSGTKETCESCVNTEVLQIIEEV